MREVDRIRRDIERAFRQETQGTLRRRRRLPWRLLPPGELTREGVLAHYKGLSRARPDRRYEPQRIVKALSLGPDEWYEGLDEFDGYVVFTFPGTENALLECPLYGNAIYVLGRDWKRLSRRSKRELLASGSARRIPHVGQWFETTKLALGLR